MNKDSHMTSSSNYWQMRRFLNQEEYLFLLNFIVFDLVENKKNLTLCHLVYELVPAIQRYTSYFWHVYVTKSSTQGLILAMLMYIHHIIEPCISFPIWYDSRFSCTSCFWTTDCPREAEVFYSWVFRSLWSY